MSNKFVTTNAAPGIDSGFLNNVENALVTGGACYFLATPYHLITNPTINSGNTSTFTATGVGGVPSGATGILMGVGVVPSGGTGYIQVAPHGGTLGNYFNFSGIVSGQYTNGFAIVPLSTGGQFDIKAVGVNMVIQDWYMFGYII